MKRTKLTDGQKDKICSLIERYNTEPRVRRLPHGGLSVTFLVKSRIPGLDRTFVHRYRLSRSGDVFDSSVRIRKE